MSALPLVVLALLASGCGSRGSSDQSTATKSVGSVGRSPRAKPGNKFRVPSLLNKHDVYAADRPGMLAPPVRHFPPRVYVPNSGSNTVDVINQRTFKVIDQFPVGETPQHVTPSYDLKTLWVNNDAGNSLTPINPATGKPGKAVPVTDPLQPLLHTERALRDRRRRAVEAARLPQHAFDGAASLVACSLSGGRSPGLHRQRPFPGREL
jgi:YVTN family beta-propeller protein